LTRIWSRRPRPTCASKRPSGTRWLARLARHLTHVLDPDAGQILEDAEDADRDGQQLLVQLRRGGGSDVRGRLGAELQRGGR
jgi:hypothetical protein